MASIKDTVFIILDCETTGLNNDQTSEDVSKIVEIAAGRFKIGEEFKIAQSLINPQMHIPSRSSAVHHIIDEDVEEAPTYEEYARRLYPKIPKDAVMVAHNKDFDAGFLVPVDGVDDIVNERRWICSYRLARILFEDLESYANQALRYELNIDVPRSLESHRAAGDIEVTKGVFEKEIEKYLELGLPDDIDSFIEYASQRYRVSKFPNGKYREQSIEEVAKTDLGYLEWYAANMKTEEDIIFSVKEAIKKEHAILSSKKKEEKKEDKQIRFKV